MGHWPACDMTLNGRVSDTGLKHRTDRTFCVCFGADFVTKVGVHSQSRLPSTEQYVFFGMVMRIVSGAVDGKCSGDSRGTHVDILPLSSTHTIALPMRAT